MLWKLLKKTLIPIQIAGYLFTLFVGISIILTTIQLYLDVKPLLFQQTDVFKNNATIISKNISLFKTMNKTKIYFTKRELEDIKSQAFVKNVSHFSSAGFKINAYTEPSASIPAFYTELFFESIPDEYLDLSPEDWIWQPDLDFIPIIIPENYLNLYNFGFAESQNLPVLSKNIISQFNFHIELSGNGKRGHFRSKIVGFSNKINSILVPEKFLAWANAEYGDDTNNISRLLIEFNNPSDERILSYFNENNYAVDKQDLELNKLSFFFKTALIFVLFVAVTIIVLSASFILLSINFIIQKNKELILNLYDIGYGHKTIALFYQMLISGITCVSVVAALFTGFAIRNYYLSTFVRLFEFDLSGNKMVIIGIVLLLLLLLSYNFLLVKSIKTTVVSKK